MDQLQQQGLLAASEPGVRERCLIWILAHLDHPPRELRHQAVPSRRAPSALQHELCISKPSDQPGVGWKRYEDRSRIY